MNIFALVLAFFELLKYVSIISTILGTILFVIGISMIMSDRKKA